MIWEEYWWDQYRSRAFRCIVYPYVERSNSSENSSQQAETQYTGQTEPQAWTEERRSVPATYPISKRAPFANPHERHAQIFPDDSGGWEVCKESREAAEREMLAYKKWDKVGKGFNPIHPSEIGSFPGIMTGDLVIIQPANRGEDKCFDYVSNALDYWGKDDADNVALRFDGVVSRTRRTAGLWRIFGPDRNLAMLNLWFIDENIIRRHVNDISIRPDRQAFYGNGVRFVEVLQTDREWIFEHGEELMVPPTDPVRSSWRRDVHWNAFTFIESLLEIFVEGKYEGFQRDTKNKEVPRRDMRLRVLATETTGRLRLVR